MSDAISKAFQAVHAQFPTLTLEMAQAVIRAYEEGHRRFELSGQEKSDLASKIRIYSDSASDAVQDVYDEVASLFIVRRREP